MSEIRVDKIVNASGSGAVEFSQGISLPTGQTLSGIAQTAESLTATANINTTGIITAASFSGDGSNLTGVGVTVDTRTNSLVVSGVSTFQNNVTISGNLTVDGTTTSIDTVNLVVEDKNIGIGSTSTPSNSTADGGGLTLFGGINGDKTLTWVNSTTAWTSNQDFNLISGKVYEINGSTVLSSSQVLGKSVPSGTIVGDTDSQTLSSKTLCSATLTGTLTANGGAGSNGQFLQSTGSGVQWATSSGGAITACCTSNFLSCNTCALSITSGSNNTFFGCDAGNSTTTGGNNTFIGLSAGRSNTFGRYNTFIGACAGRLNTTACNNIFLGNYAGAANSTGGNNFFAGCFVGRCNTTGCNNTFIGNNTGFSNTFGRYNTFIGQAAGYYNTSADSNVFIGRAAGCCNSVGAANVFIGNCAGRLITAGCNVVIGGFAGTGFTSCTNHIFLSDGAGNNRAQFNGSGALGLNGANYGSSGQVLTSCGSGMAPVWAAGGGSAAVSIDGSSNIFSCNTVGCGQNNFFMGCGAGVRSFGGGGFPECNIAIGAQAGQYSGAYSATSRSNIYFGFQAGQYKSGGCNNFFAGLCAGRSSYNDLQSTTGSSNVAIGFFAGACLTVGSNNIFLGRSSGLKNTTGNNNTFLGQESGSCITTGSSNIAVGTCAGKYNTIGTDNIAIGKNAYVLSATGSCNIAIGSNAGVYHCGERNIFMGTYTGGGSFGSSTGQNNVFLGSCAGRCNGSGSNNFFAGMCSGFDNTTGCNNIAIGCNSGNDFLYDFGATGGSNIIVMGNCNHSAAYVQVSWTTGSDARDKTNIIPIPVGKEFLMQLNPVQYQWADRETGEVRVEKPNYGFLAQDILALENPPQVVVDDHDPEHLKLRESMIVPILVKTVQELIGEVDALKEEVRILKGE